MADAEAAVGRKLSPQKRGPKVKGLGFNAIVSLELLASAGAQGVSTSSHQHLIHAKAAEPLAVQLGARIAGIGARHAQAIHQSGIDLRGLHAFLETPQLRV